MRPPQLYIKRPSYTYGVEGAQQKMAEFCAQHKAEGMVTSSGRDVLTPCSCNKTPSYDMEVSKTRQFGAEQAE